MSQKAENWTIGSLLLGSVTGGMVVLTVGMFQSSGSTEWRTLMVALTLIAVVVAACTVHVFVDSTKEE